MALYLLAYARVGCAVCLPAVLVVERVRPRDVVHVHLTRALRHGRPTHAGSLDRACGPSRYSSAAPESVLTSIMTFCLGGGVEGLHVEERRVPGAHLHGFCLLGGKRVTKVDSIASPLSVRNGGTLAPLIANMARG